MKNVPWMPFWSVVTSYSICKRLKEPPCITPEGVRSSIQEHLQWLKKEIKKLDREIEQFIQDQPEFKQKDALLQSVPGIGKVTSSKLIADVPELGVCDRKEIAALIGTAPYSHDSGFTR